MVDEDETLLERLRNSGLTKALGFVLCSRPKLTLILENKFHHGSPFTQVFLSLICVWLSRKFPKWHSKWTWL